MLDELIKDDVEVKLEVYKRKDFDEIKDMLKNFNQEEYKFFKIARTRGIIDEKIKFVYFKTLFITLVGIIFYMILLFK